MTKARTWPNNAKEIRDRAAEEAIRGLLAIEPLLEASLTKEDQIRRIAITISSLRKIERLLKEVGAQTRPV